MRRLSVPNQVLAVEVVDRREIEFPNLGDLLTRDPETDFEHTTGDSNPRARMDADSAAQRKVEACRMYRYPNLTGRHERAGRSRTCNTSGPPVRVSTIAFMIEI